MLTSEHLNIYFWNTYLCSIMLNRDIACKKQGSKIVLLHSKKSLHSEKKFGLIYKKYFL